MAAAVDKNLRHDYNNRLENFPQSVQHLAFVPRKVPRLQERPVVGLATDAKPEIHTAIHVRYQYLDDQTMGICVDLGGRSYGNTMHIALSFCLANNACLAGYYTKKGRQANLIVAQKASPPLEAKLHEKIRRNINRRE